MWEVICFDSDLADGVCDKAGLDNFVFVYFFFSAPLLRASRAPLVVNCEKSKW